MTHGRRVAKGGSVDYVPEPRRGADNPSYKADTVGYSGAHARVRSARGPARDRVCQCGAPARHWSYRHDDPEEQVSTDGLPYSVDPEHYDALCTSCHKRRDLARASRVW